MSCRVGVAGLWHETNTYGPHPATLADFAAFELLEGDAIFDKNAGTGSVIGGFADAKGYDLVPLLSAGAWPSGPADGPTIDALLGRLADVLRRARGLDGLLLNLHGAMVATGVADTERAVVDLVRDTLGGVPVAGVLDLHANPSPELAAACDVLVSYDTYPHVDMRQRGLEAAAFMSEMLGGRRLRTTVGKVPLLVCPLAQSTDAEPMASLQERATRLGNEAGLARICITGGFAYSDVDRAGMSVLAIHDDDRDDDARTVVREVLAEIAARAPEFAIVRDDAPTAVRRALASTARPVILVDVGDNIGGGSPGDGTVLLAELLSQGARGAVVTIADAGTARRAADVGVGAEIDALIGGKSDDRHGGPVRIRGRVEQLSDGRYRTAGSWMTGHEFSMGQTAVVSVAGNTLVVVERPTPPFHAEQLTSAGIDPREATVIVAKGAIAWRAAYGDIAGDVVEAATPGVCPVDISSLPRYTVPMAVAP